MSDVIACCLIDRPFPSCPKSLFQSEAKRYAIDLRKIFDSRANNTRFHKKEFAFGPRFWNPEMAYSILVSSIVYVNEGRRHKTSC